jgi:hypothetical protein
MYWKDVLKGGAEIYQKAGCEVVSAGHMFDPLFLRRLKTIIECATIAAGPEGGTSVGYCVALGKPFFFIPTQFGHQMQEISNLAAMEDELNRSKPFYQRVEEVFGTVPSENTTAQQHSLVNEFWGLSSKRSPDELRLIFEICEDLFTRSQRTGVANRNYCFEALTDYVQSKSTAKALLVMDELEASDPESTKEMSIIRGFCLLQSGKRNEARAVIENFLRLHPGHEGALQVLNLCGA